MKSKKIHIPLFLLFILFAIPERGLSSNNEYLRELSNKAIELQLHRDIYWERLLAYRESGKGLESMIDDPVFFLAEDGKKNPETELVATLEAFFKENPEPDKHPRCRFVARYAWLKDKLGIDESRLPEAACPDFEESFAKVNPKKTVLVFPASFINSPASMFGHTLIRIDSDYDSPLLAYSISYAAQTGESSGILFAVKGIFGYYHGLYSVLPYYAKVKDYSDLEQRDIWEYELDLTKEETTKLFLQVWELRDIYSYYYFFDENCASLLLYLLETARPSLRLSEKLKPWAIPADTVKIIREEGIIKNAVYRPSMAKKIKHIASLLDDNEEQLAKDIAEKRLPATAFAEKPLSDETKRRILDLSSEFAHFLYSKQRIGEKEYPARMLEILSARSKLGASRDGIYDIEKPLEPEMGHKSGRLSVGLGSRDHEIFSEIKYRPAYHDLMDPGDGFIPGSQIIFGEVTLRYHEAPGRLRLKHLDVIDIVSISQRDRFFKYISWKVNTGVMESRMPDRNFHLHTVLNPAGGVAFKAGEKGTSYVFIETDLRTSGRYRNNYSLGAGASAGIFSSMSDRWKAHLYGGVIKYGSGDINERYFFHLDQSLIIDINNNLFLNFKREKSYDRYESDLSAGWKMYF